jgi:hypothetical protein
MPCITLNSYSLENPIVAGDTIIGTGTSNFRDAPIAYYYDNAYSGIFLRPAQLSGIPNGATLTRIEFQTELLTNGTYVKDDVNRYIYQIAPPFSNFPLNCQVGGYSSTDTAYNNAITNYQQTDSLLNMTIVKVSSDPNIMWRGFDLQNPYTGFDNTKCLAIIYNCLDTDYATGTQSYPRIKCVFGSNTRLFYNDRRDNNPYSLTDFVNFQASYFPNIRIYYE